MSKKEKKKELKAMKKMSGEVKNFWTDFIAFIKRGNALSMAIGVIVGGAFTAIVTSFNKDIITPLISALFGTKDLVALRYPLWNSNIVKIDGVVQYDEFGQVLYDNAIYYGRLLQAAVDFIMIAFVLFLILRIVTAISNSSKKNLDKLKNKLKKIEEVKPEPVVEAPAPVIPEDVKLLTEIRDLLAKNENKKTNKK